MNALKLPGLLVLAACTAWASSAEIGRSGSLLRARLSARDSGCRPRPSALQASRQDG